MVLVVRVQVPLPSVFLCGGALVGVWVFEFMSSVAGVMVSIAAFQAVDPGSIPGPRIFGVCFLFVVPGWRNR